MPRSLRPRRLGGHGLILGATLLLCAVTAGLAGRHPEPPADRGASDPTIWCEDPEPLMAGGAPADFGNHAATRLVDWDSDGLLDVLVGAGDGHVWLIRNVGTAAEPQFAEPEPVESDGAPVRVGTGYTGACFADLTGDGLPDLVVADGSTVDTRRVRMYENVGTPGAPRFSGFEELRGPSGPDLLPPNTRGRIDVADWDADGAPDLLTGDFDGYVWWLRNVSTPGELRFADPAHVVSGLDPIHWPYNTHPRAIDLNLDGLVDLASGINWGWVFVYAASDQSPGSPPTLPRIGYIRDRWGERLEFRDLIGDDTTPDFGDLNADGVLDMVSGGFNGKLQLMYGVPHGEQLARIDALMDQHGDELADVLESDEAVRRELFGLHHSMREYMGDFLQQGHECSDCKTWYANHVETYPHYFEKRYLDPAVHGYIPFLAGQVHVNLVESDTDRPAHRQWVAETIRLTGILRDVLQDFGTMVVDNEGADLRQEEVIHAFLGSLPRPVWDAEMISIKEFLGQDPPEEVELEARTGVNIFGVRVGEQSENSFPPDIAPYYVDSFLICLAHEITHTIDRWYVELDAALRGRRDALLERAGSEDLEYLRSQVGADFFQENPQEFLASIGNEWFGSGEWTFELARSRFDRGYREPMHQFLLFVEIFSLGGDDSWLHWSDVDGNLGADPAPLRRDARGHISTVVVGDEQVDFTLDQDGYVLSYTTSPADRDGDGAVNIRDCAPDDPGAFSVPGEVGEVMVFADEVTVVWEHAADGAGVDTVHDVLRGLLSGLPVGSGAAEDCLASETPKDWITDPELPPSGDGFWYLVRGRNVCGIGTYGNVSGGPARTSGACP
jgi:hypothetical protein